MNNLDHIREFVGLRRSRSATRPGQGDRINQLNQLRHEQNLDPMFYAAPPHNNGAPIDNPPPPQGMCGR